MVDTIKTQPVSPRGTVYLIRIKGHLDSQWAGWFEELTIKLEDKGDTLLTGQVTDQSALHGLLRKIRDFGMTLVSVNLVEVDETHQDQTNKEG